MGITLLARMLRLPCTLLMLSAILWPLVRGTATFASSGTTLYQQGQAAAKSGRYATAAHDFEQAILSGHNDPDTYYQLGLVYSHLKRWNDAAWAIAQALSDSAFSAQHQHEATKALLAASQAGGVDEGPPAVLSHATMSPGKMPPPNPRALAVRESQRAYQALLTGAFFVGPAYNKLITYGNVGVLSKAAADANNDSSTDVKFAFLSATPLPFTSLSNYARALFKHLGMQHALLVVMTPQATSAYTDRLDAARAQRIAKQWANAHASLNPADLAAGIARAVVAQANNNDDAASHRTAAIGIGITLLIVVLIGLAIMRIIGGGSIGSARSRRRTTLTPRPRSR